MNHDMFIHTLFNTYINNICYTLRLRYYHMLHYFIYYIMYYIMYYIYYYLITNIILYYYVIFIVGYIYNIRIMYYTRIIQEDIVTLPVGIREGIIRGNGYVLNMKYWIYIITSYLYISYCCNVYLNYNLFVYTSYTNAYIGFSVDVSSCLYQHAYYIYMTIVSSIV